MRVKRFLPLTVFAIALLLGGLGNVLANTELGTLAQLCNASDTVQELVAADSDAPDDGFRSAYLIEEIDPPLLAVASSNVPFRGFRHSGPSRIRAPPFRS
ncbi:hypothetical protein [Saccharospirillum alexandrii]|uniref:hypothetical protein n=1 Tax=Saccharospirillum alexandrii TaxID=2448477 RepID=UPI000FD87D34|nr:hypothetical protein [Saccharospirillum alexandrii]